MFQWSNNNNNNSNLYLISCRVVDISNHSNPNNIVFDQYHRISQIPRGDFCWFSNLISPQVRLYPSKQKVLSNIHWECIHLNWILLCWKQLRVFSVYFRMMGMWSWIYLCVETWILATITVMKKYVSFCYSVVR